MKNKYLILLFTLALILFVILLKKINFHDSYEYIGIAKNFIGINNFNVHVGHPILYPFILSLFLRISQSFILMKLVNVFWLILMGITLLYYTKNKKAFILFAFSPLIWFVSAQISPVLPASFFFLLSSIFINKNKFFSGLFLGLSCAFYTPMFLVSLIFTLVYFWNKSLSKLFIYITAIILGLLPMFLLDFYFFNFPFYTMLRHFGAQFIISSGLSPTTNDFHLIEILRAGDLEILWVFVAISPFLFRLYKLKFNEYKHEIIFLVLTGLIFFFRASLLKYFLIICPIIFILLSKVLNKKEIKWHGILSIFIIILISWNFFISNEEILIQKDLEEINLEFNEDYLIADSLDAMTFGALRWENKPFFIWYNDYEASLENKTYLRKYELSFAEDSKMKLKDTIKISVFLNRYEDITYEDYLIVSRIGVQKNWNVDYNLIKCYEVLCVYER